MLEALRLNLVLVLTSAACFSQSSGDPTGSVNPATPAAVAMNPLGEAKALYRKGNFDGAIASYQEFLQQHPQSPDAYAGLVRVYLKQKNIELAAQTVDKGLAQSNSPRMHVARGELWFRQGKINEAEKEWVDAINAGFPEARAYLGLARVRDSIAMYKSAKNMIDKAHQFDPGDPDIEDEWMGTLPRAQQIKYLRDALAGDNNWDAEEREDLKSYLDFLEKRAKQKTGACRLVSKVTATEAALVPLMEDPRHLRGFGLSVALNGRKSALMLDTGASGILVKRSLAEHAHISKITETKIGGIGDKGRRNAYYGLADSIKIGELEFQNCRVEVMESRSVADGDGLIGADVFQNFLVEIDFPNEKLKLSQLPKRPGEPEQKLTLKSEEDDAENETPDQSSETGAETSAETQVAAGDAGSKDGEARKAEGKPAAKSWTGPQDRYIAPEMQSYSHVFRFGHNLLIPTTIGNVSPKLFLIDTGSLVNFISAAAAREVTKVHNNSDVIVEGLNGRVAKVYSANKAVLQFGHLRQENQDMTAFDLTGISDKVGTEVSGLLGFVMLRMLDIKIDYRDALIDFQYDPKRWR
jgi:tetratricopeptide (TPR) repeat protein